jgi:ABC-type bacteriocin/lantibiotic exporter with double-glycine peptidase domain
MNFTYGKELPNVLEGVDLKIPFGSFVGVVGRSGAGKSTLTDLLLGFQEPTSGSVKIGDINAGDYVLENPGLVAYVPQKSHIFSGSIIENVLLEINPKGYDSIQLERALNATRMLEYVNSLPEGIHTRVGEGVRELSGGQAQRLSLTRALYRNPKILVLDETTSALDSRTKAEIESVIQELAGSMTIISITHNAKSLSDFDVVLEVTDGSVRAR